MMAPNPESSNIFPIKSNNSSTGKRLRHFYNNDIVWRNVIVMAVLHALFVYSLYLLFTFKLKLGTFIFVFVYVLFGGIGTGAGVHRLWAHRSYKANLPLRVLLMLAQTSCLQNSIYEWVRDHRVHHKFVDTNADPHNSTRGFFFSHVGWLLTKKHKDVIVQGRTVDISDLLQDPVVRFQKKYYIPLVLVMHTVLPTFIMWYFVGEDLVSASVATIGRYVYSLNCTWLVNSAAHMWGMKPFDKNIRPTENGFVSIMTGGEGWHNYHHVFPWDYRASEWGRSSFSTTFLNFMARIGWATDLKVVPQELIDQRVLRTGDPAVFRNSKHKHA